MELGRGRVTERFTASGQKFCNLLIEGEKMEFARIYSTLKWENVGSPGIGFDHLFAQMGDTDVRKIKKKEFRIRKEAK